MSEAINFDSVVEERVETPFSKKALIKLSFSDPRLQGFHVLVVADTANSLTSSNENRLTTLVTRFPRYVLSELNTHRVFSRNSASSRARSVKATIQGVMEDPFIPLWTINKKGMSGKFASPKVAEAATKRWLEGRNAAVATELGLLIGDEIFNETSDLSEVAKNYEAILDAYYKDGYDTNGEETANALSIHKQNANRILEPFMWHESIITSSYWGNFLELRDHDEAQPEIRALAILISEALKRSAPKDNWIHAPFIDPESLPKSPVAFNEIREVMLLSATECAQISYKDKTAAKVSSATTTLGERLFEMKHLSPFEHQGITRESFVNEVAPASTGIVVEDANLVSNFDSSWVQLRPILAGITK